jgi:hypothetical protein
MNGHNMGLFSIALAIVYIRTNYTKTLCLCNLTELIIDMVNRSSEESATGDTDESSTSTTGKEHKQQEEGAKNQGQYHIFSFTRYV